MTEAASVQWFPGHMAKTRRMIKASLSVTDAVVEVIDARIPKASRSTELDKIIGTKPKIVILNKSDFADEAATKLWIKYYSENGVTAIAADCRSGNGLGRFSPTVKRVLSELLAKRKAKGVGGKALRLMVVGIPNVGKSSFINRMAGQSKAKVEDRPGVTRDKQWVTVDKEIELLDMPGILAPKFEDKQVGEYLAFTGAVKDDVVDIEVLACRLLEVLNAGYHDTLKNRYPKISDSADVPGYELLEQVGMSRGLLISGGEVSMERAASVVLGEVRNGRLGRITLELPDRS